jgi:hypothetical protein
VAPLNGRQALFGLAVGIAGTLAVHWWRALPWSLAAVVGLAMAVLAIASLRTGERLRGVWSREPRWRARR